MSLVSSVGFQGESHLELDGKIFPRNSKDEKLELTFSTLEESGLLVWKGQKETDGEVTSEDYMMISLRGGRPHVEYDLGGGQMTVSLGQKVNDDLPHTLSIARSGRHVSLGLDGLHQQNETSTGSYQVFNTEGNIFVGGGGPRPVTELTRSRFSKTFVGCVHSLVINNRATDFNNHVQASNLVPCQE